MISRDLASQFAKITNDKNKQKEEIVYGTVVTQGDKLYVNLDGSNSITPIVTTAEIKSGERVAVMIKGHTATVIGNITNPGASTETTGKILDDYDVIVAKIGDFELIVADKITTEQLEAELAIIEELIAEKASIEELEAVKATIKDLDVTHLEAEIAEIEKAVITKAEISDLDAIHANIEILEAGLAEIETLVGGNLTMDNIQSLVLTASKVTVDNAFIKDAMIDRVSASKLTAGTINTNMIQIASEDGSMAINGSLQQFKDENGKVRIQIGKDSTGDFTFVLYGEDGKGQLINQNGITASAIGDGIIVNDMVADNANISGGKLDISSVVTEINNNTTTINSSVIQFDDTGQSLTVAFNTLKDTVEIIKDVSIDGDFSAAIEQIESLNTEVQVIQGEIDTLVSSTTIVKENGETVLLKDDYSSTKQTVNEVSSKVSSLETTTEEVVSKQVELEQTLEGFELSVSNSYVSKDAFDNTVGGINDAVTDMNEKFNDYYTKSETESKLSVLEDSISMKVSQTEVDDKFIDYEQNIQSNMDSALQQGINDALISVSELYAKKDEFDSFQSSVNSQFEQTASDIQMTFSEAIVATNTVNDNLEIYKAEVSTYIRFDENGIEMGKNDSPFKSTLSNEKLAFMQDGNEVAYISNNRMYVTETEVLNSMILGNWIWIIGSDGNLTLKWRDE